MQLKRLWSFFASSFLTAWAPLAFAHPGHGTTDPTSPAHAAEPIHLLPLVVISVGLVVGGHAVARRLKLAREKK